MKQGMLQFIAVLMLAGTVWAADDAPDKKKAEKGEGESSALPRVKLETTLGDIVLELNAEKAPISTKNFLQYVKDDYYDGLIFHRVIPNFMIQAGGFDTDYEPQREGLRKPIKNESRNGLSNERGTIAMARTGAPHSATAQFFINVKDNTQLDASDRMPWGYAVFGKVVEGMDVVDKIRNTEKIVHPKDPGGGREGAVNPDPPVVIKDAVVLQDLPEDQAKDSDEKDGEDAEKSDQPVIPQRTDMDGGVEK